MKREFSFCYIGVNDEGLHHGIVTDLKMMRSNIGRFRKPMQGVQCTIEAKSKSELWEVVKGYVRNYPGKHDAMIVVNKVIHEVKA